MNETLNMAASDKTLTTRVQATLEHVEQLTLPMMRPADAAAVGSDKITRKAVEQLIAQAIKIVDQLDVVSKSLRDKSVVLQERNWNHYIALYRGFRFVPLLIDAVKSRCESIKGEAEARMLLRRLRVMNNMTFAELLESQADVASGNFVTPGGYSDEPQRRVHQVRRGGSKQAHKRPAKAG